MSASPIPPPPPAAPVGPRYRYTQIPPATITLRAGDLVPLVPQNSWILGSDADQLLEFPASAILSGPVPKVALSKLAELAPKCFRVEKEGEATTVRLPVNRLAAAYQMVSQRELVEETWVAPTPVPVEETVSLAEPSRSFASGLIADISPVEEFAPPVGKAPVDPVNQEKLPSFEPPVSENLPPSPPPPTSSEFAPPPVSTPEAQDKAPAPPARRIFSVLPMFRRKDTDPILPEPPAVDASPVEAPAPARRPRVELPPPKTFAPSSLEEANPGALPRFAPKPPLGAITTASWTTQPPLPPPPTSPTLVEAYVADPAPEAPVGAINEPVIETPLVGEPPVAANPPAEPTAESPVPPTPSAAPEPIFSEPPVSVAVPPTPVVPPPLARPEPSPAVLVETEHFTASQSQSSSLANQDDLQAIFLTEETLTPERIVELCGGFPGINSCVLSRGGGVIASHNVPDTIDLVSLSAHALEMIRAMRESSAKMGVGAVPAVTIHSEKGPITFFHEEDLCFLVLHKDRGFVPGVREKLQNVVHHLAQARLPRPISQPSRILEG